MNVFDQTVRQIRCIEKKHDYLGNGMIFTENELEVGRLYTFIHGSAESYGNMVHLKELPNRCGYQSYLFEELDPYDEDVLISKQREWLGHMLEEGLQSIREGRTISEEELDEHFREKKEELFSRDVVPSYIEEHDPGASYWIMPVRVRLRDGSRVENIDVEELGDEISILQHYFDPYLTDFFTENIDMDLEVNKRRISYDFCDEGRPVIGFGWYLEYNFYAYDDIKKILEMMKARAELFKAHSLDGLKPRTLKDVKFALARAAEKGIGHNDALENAAAFYESLCTRLQKMMDDNPDGEYISVMGP